MEESVFSGAKENGGYHMNRMKLSFSLCQPAARGSCLKWGSLKWPISNTEDSTCSAELFLANVPSKVIYLIYLLR